MPSPLHRAKSASMSAKTTTGSGTRPEELKYSDSPLPTRTYTPTTADLQHEFLARPTPDSVDGTWSRKNTPLLGHSRSGSNFQALNVSDNRISASPSIVMSSMSSMPSLTQTQPQRKPSGLKATIKRMFGSKRRRTLVAESRQEFHRSDPGNLMTTGQSQHQRGWSSGSSRPRTATRGGALTSHAVNPAASDVQDFGASHAEQPASPFRRRNTLPSLAFSEHEAQSFSQRIGHMHDDIQQTFRNETVTSISDKRRSKSADELAARYIVDASDAANRQDRESEIAFWRNSMLLNPLPKSTGNASRDLRPDAPLEHVKEMSSLEHIINPAQGFDFGLDTVDDEPADLDERLNTLEVKMFDFEYAIAKLQGIELPKPRLPTKKMRRKNVQEVFTKPSMRSLSTATSGFDRPPITPEDSPLLPNSFKDSDIADRGSNATIRPFIRVDSPQRSSFRLTAEQYDSLMNMIQDEKDARQLMEMQIVDLQREIASLQTPVYATINYPTSEPNKGVSTQKKLHRSPPFRFHRPMPRETSRFSMTESDADSFNDGYEEPFQTPREQQHAFGSARSSPLIGMV